MRYLFVIMGVGYGHVTRAQALINEILKKDNDAKIRIAGYDHSYEYFSGKYPITKIRGFKLPGLGFNLSVWQVIKKNLMAPFNWVYNRRKLKKLILRFNPDVIVSEFEPVVLKIAAKYKKRTFFIFNYDFEKENPFTSRFLVQNGFIRVLYNAGKKYATKIVIPCLSGAKQSRGKFMYVNPIVRNKPKELGGKDVLMRKLKLKREPILVMLSGEGFGDQVAKDVIRISKDFDEDFIIFGYRDFIKDNIRGFKFNENFLEYLKVCKGVVTLGGHSTLSELLVFKKPALVLPITNHLEQNVNGFEIRNLMMVKRNYKKGIAELLRRFLERRRIIEKKLIRVSLKGEGASQLVDVLAPNKKPR